MIIARRFIVRGRVQGVGFRFFAVRAARQCGVVGVVRNLPDGSVEAIAQGGAASVDRFRKELARGPSFSQVDAVEASELKVTVSYTGFDVAF